jgi:hypothetical protein
MPGSLVHIPFLVGLGGAGANRADDGRDEFGLAFLIDR